MDPRRRKLAAVAGVLLVVGVLAFLFLWPVPQSSSGEVQSSALRETETTANLPGNTVVTVTWHTTDGAPVIFGMAEPAAGGYSSVWPCSGVEGAASACSFVPPAGAGAYYVFADPVPGDTTPHTVEFTISYDSPLL
jgi:hypothetical protein